MELAPRGIGIWDDTDLLEKFEAVTPTDVDPWDIDWFLSDEREVARRHAKWAFNRALDLQRVPLEDLKRFGLEAAPTIPGAYRVDKSRHPVWMSLADLVVSYHFRSRQDDWTWLDDLIERGFLETNAQRLRAYLVANDPVAAEIDAWTTIFQKNKPDFERFLRNNPDLRAYMESYMALTLKIITASDQIWHEWSVTLFGLFERRYQRVLVATARELGINLITFVRNKREEEFLRSAAYIVEGEAQRRLTQQRSRLRDPK